MDRETSSSKRAFAILSVALSVLINLESIEDWLMPRYSFVFAEGANHKVASGGGSFRSKTKSEPFGFILSNTPNTT